MSFKIVRNNIINMNTEAIVNTANSQVAVGSGCDNAVYEAAGRDELLRYRREKIGVVPEGEVFITPGFKLQAKYIIHAVSPRYDEAPEVENKLRSCYWKSLQLARENNVRSIAFPLIFTDGFGYPKEESLRIAVDEINSFLLCNDMDIILVVFDQKFSDIGERLYPDLEAYISQHYVEDELTRESGASSGRASMRLGRTSRVSHTKHSPRAGNKEDSRFFCCRVPDYEMSAPMSACYDVEEELEEKLSERMKHLSNTFSEYLMYLIQKKKMANADVWKRAIIDKKTFSKIKNNRNYHPDKLTALCLCIGAKLNLDESKDLLARAGYALSPCDKTDIIFSYFIENDLYDMIDLDIQLEEHGLPCIIK